MAIVHFVNYKKGTQSRAANVDTRVTYTVTYEGGDINSKRVNSSGVPDGDYKVCIVNGGSKSITGAMQYEVK